MKKIIILGLTNVGKSTLLNKICGKSISTTFHEPDTTLDYISVYFSNGILVDTAGIKTLENLKDLEKKIFKTEDLILMVVNKNINDMEKSFIDYLRKKYQILLVVNKENKDIENFQSFGLDCIFTSAKTGYNIKKLKEKINLDKILDDKKIKIAIIGKTNVGKSTLLNSIVGYDRAIVKDEIGTTRDMLKVEFKDFVFIDTPGYRNSQEHLDKISKIRRHQVLSIVDGIIVVLDTSKPFTNLDKKMLQEAEKYGKFVIFCGNKSDIISKNFNNYYFPNLLLISALKNNLNELFDYLNNTINSLNKTLVLPKFNMKNLISIKQTSTNPMIFNYKGDIGKNMEKFIKRSIEKINNIYGVKVFLNKIL